MRDHCTQEGAQELAERLTRFWAGRGVEINAWIEESSFSPHMRSNYWIVRSNLINGWPAELNEKARAGKVAA